MSVLRRRVPPSWAVLAVGVGHTMGGEQDRGKAAHLFAYDHSASGRVVPGKGMGLEARGQWSFATLLCGQDHSAVGVGSEGTRPRTALPVAERCWASKQGGKG